MGFRKALSTASGVQLALSTEHLPLLPQGGVLGTLCDRAAHTPNPSAQKGPGSFPAGPRAIVGAAVAPPMPAACHCGYPSGSGGRPARTGFGRLRL